MPAERSSHDVSVQHHLCRCAELAASLHQKNLRYVKRFERGDTCKGWLRYIVGAPRSAIAAVAERKTLPLEWRRQPMSEIDFLVKLAWDQFRGLSNSD